MNKTVNLSSAQPKMTFRKLFLQGKTRFSETSERGVALLELAIVVGFIILLFLTALEIILIVGNQEKLSIFSREAANVATRSCANLPDPTVCLNSTRTTLFGLTSNSVDGSDLNISIFHYDSGTNTVTAFQALGSIASRYQQANFETGPLGKPDLRSLLIDQRTLIISEVSAPYRPVGISLGLGNLYEVTIF